MYLNMEWNIFENFYYIYQISDAIISTSYFMA